MQCLRSYKIPLFVVYIAKERTKIKPVGAQTIGVKLFTVSLGHPVCVVCIFVASQKMLVAVLWTKLDPKLLNIS